jgi:hypothetical protein
LPESVKDDGKPIRIRDRSFTKRHFKNFQGLVDLVTRLGYQEVTKRGRRRGHTRIGTMFNARNTGRNGDAFKAAAVVRAVPVAPYPYPQPYPGRRGVGACP